MGLQCDLHEMDRQDIAASLRGDGTAYARLVQRYEPAVTRQMWRYSRDAWVVRELMQQVFVEAFRSLPGYRPQAPFLHWLRRIASRVGYRYWKVQRRERERVIPLEEWHERAAAVAVERQEPSEAAEHLFTFLERLPPKDRMVLTLMYFEGCDVQSVAERMGWSRTLVKVRAYRARQRLRTMLEEAGYGKQRHA